MTAVILLVTAVKLLLRPIASAVGGIGAAIVWLPVAPIPLLAVAALYLGLNETALQQRRA